MEPIQHVWCTHQAVRRLCATGTTGKAAYLEREQGLEVVVDLPGVGAAPPVAGQIVSVCHHLQQSQLGVKGCSWLLYEGSAQGQNDAQHCCPPTSE